MSTIERNSTIERKSYAQRRELFKDIWNATLLFENDGETGADVTVKPKIIKTLRLERSGLVKASIRKKRLKNLRAVCNKILAFCDRQEEENLYTDRMPSGYAPKNLLNTSYKTKKKKVVKKAKKSLFPTKENALAKTTDYEKNLRNIRGDDAAVPVDKTRKRVKRAVPMVKGAVPMVASQMTSKLTSTRSPRRHASSPSSSNRQRVVNKKCVAKKKRSTEI